MTNTPAPNSLELQLGPLRLQLLPGLGGSVGGLWHGELPVLRHTESPTGPRLTGGFPMVPYSNRLGYRRFRWRGQEFSTRANFDANPHTVHGNGWMHAWRVLQAGSTQAELAYTHTPDEDWPFAYEATQRFVLSETGLRLELSVANTDARVQPLGLGWHPYFPKRDRSRLHAEVAERWERDAGTELPTRKVAQPSLDGDVAYMEFDHCFEGWQGAARLRDEKLTLRLSSSMNRLVIYTPQTKPYYCVEPVSHVSNAIHMADPQACGLAAVEPGASLSAWINLDVARV